MKRNDTVLFRESQQVREPWVWIIFTVSMLAAIAGVVVMAYQPDVSIQERRFAIGVVIPVCLLVFALLYYVRMEIMVTNEGVHYRWAPFMKKYFTISSKEIELVEVKPVPWFNRGFHVLPGFGTVHNVSGGKGLRFTLRNGKRIFLGSSKAFAFEQAVNDILNSPNRK